jgi:hypothetical protein
MADRERLPSELQISREDFETIERLIGDPSSPVGIDAKKTHVIIIHKLLELERRLERLERRHGNAIG